MALWGMQRLARDDPSGQEDVGLQRNGTLPARLNDEGQPILAVRELLLEHLWSMQEGPRNPPP